MWTLRPCRMKIYDISSIKLQSSLSVLRMFESGKRSHLIIRVCAVATDSWQLRGDGDLKMKLGVTPSKVKTPPYCMRELLPPPVHVCLVQDLSTNHRTTGYICSLICSFLNQWAKQLYVFLWWCRFLGNNYKLFFKIIVL